MAHSFFVDMGGFQFEEYQTLSTEEMLVFACMGRRFPSLFTD